MNLVQIATFRGPLKEKFGIPRQSGLASALEGSIVFEPGFRDANALRGLEGFSHIWLLWGFSANRATGWTPTVRPPRLGGNTAMGVFATRSPYRPNPIGLSAVRINHIEVSTPDGPVIHVAGADLMDGTPIYDIKPYVTYADAHPDASSGFVDDTPWKPLTVVIPEDIRRQIIDIEALEQILAQDPRPQYHRTSPVMPDQFGHPQKEYGLAYGPWNIRFTVIEDTLTVLSIK